MPKQKRKLYRTKFHNLEEMDLRAVEWCMQCGSCLNDHRIAVGVHGACPMFRHNDGNVFEPYFSRGRNQAIRAILEGRLEPSQNFSNSVYLCTVCNNCNEVCHNGYDKTISMPLDRVMDHAAVFEALRADLVELGFEHLPGHRVLIASLADNDNPWGQPRRSKADWARRVKDTRGVNLHKNKENIDVLFYTGCTASLDRSLADVCVSTAQLLDKAGVSWGFLGQSEICCGCIAFRVGELALMRDVAKRNVEMLNDLYDNYGMRTIVTSCAGCFKAMFQDYPEVAHEIGKLKAEVLPTALYVQRLKEEGKLSFNVEVPVKATYHDPCHIGRHCRIYEGPRELLQSIPGCEFVEMPRNRELALCCGCGGGVKSGYPDVAMGIGIERIQEAVATEANCITTACPFCEQNIRDAIKGANSGMVLLDIVQLAAISCGAKEAVDMNTLAIK